MSVHNTDDWSSPPATRARSWVQTEAAGVIAEINERFEHWFLENVDGQEPRARSSYGIPYTNYAFVVGLADDQPWEDIRLAFLEYVERCIEKMRDAVEGISASTCVVWRLRPEFTAESGTRELIKLRFRCHVLSHEALLAPAPPVVGLHPAAGNGIGWAIKVMWDKNRVRRAGWNGKNMHLEMQIPDAHSKMTLPYVYMFTAQGDLVPWLCSQTDLLAVDWELAQACDTLTERGSPLSSGGVLACLPSTTPSIWRSSATSSRGA